MKKLFIFLFLTCSFLSFFAQKASLYPIKEGNLWGYINAKGTIVVKPQFYAAKPFAEGVAAVREKGGYGFINEKGEFVIAPKYDYAYSFSGSLAKVFRNVKPFFIDKNGNTVFEHPYAEIEDFWKVETNVLAKPQFNLLHKEDSEKELILTEKDHKMRYVNLLGETIWEEDTTFWKENKLDIDFTLDANFQIKGEYRPAYLGGRRANYNPQKRIYPDIPKKEIRLFCHLSENEPIIFREKYKGMKFYIVNLDRDSLYFSEYAASLYANLQAKNEKGEWQDIDFLKGIFCGNGYNIRALAPDTYWEFSVPVYTGEFQTKMRVKLQYKKAINQEKSNVMYSNEVDVWINKAQFWNKDGYFMSEFYEY